MKDYFLLAWKNLKRRKLRSWLTVLGVFIGVAAVVSLISIGQSLQNAISSQFSGLEPDKITIQNINSGFGPPSAGSISSLTKNEIDLIKKNPRVKEVFGQYLKPLSVNFNKISKNTYTSSVPMDSNLQKIQYQSIDDLEKGNLLSSNDIGKVMVGSDIVKEEYFERELRIGDKILIEGKEFRIGGILSKTGSFTTNLAIFMLSKDMEDIIESKEEYDYINIYVKDIKQTEQVAEEIRESLRRDRKEDIGEESFSVTTAQNSLQSINSILSIVNVIVIAIATIALIIGGIGVANTMFTSVIERQDEIGIQKAIGAKNSAIELIFLFEAGLLCLFGGFTGALFGLFLSWGIASVSSYFLGDELFKITISWSLLIGSALFSFIIGLIAGYIPSKQASKLNPVEALRKK